MRHCKADAPAEVVVADTTEPRKIGTVSVIAMKGGYSVLFDGGYLIEDKFGRVIGRFPTEADAKLNLQGLLRFKR